MARVAEGVDGGAAPPRWRMVQEGDQDVVMLDGDWLARDGIPPGIPPVIPLDIPTPAPAPVHSNGTEARPLRIDASGLGHWDSGLIAFLWDTKRAAAGAGRSLDTRGLPPAAGKLLNLLADRPPAAVPRVGHGFRPLYWIGGQAVGFLNEVGTISLLCGATVRGAALALVGGARMRLTDLSANVADAGPSALIIVGVVNFLTGAILAFVGAVQLRKFAADIYVANLVGLAMVREMAAVMTAIVMAGRTGGAYAARIATMQGNEEIDALTVIGIPVTDYIVLPAVLGLVATMPFLYLFGCLIGILGGFAVAMGMLNVTAAGFLNQTIDAVSLGQFAFGFTKSIAFAMLIGISGCRIGLRAGRSAADVGVAATRAVVTGIVGVIALDAIFAVIANIFGL